MRSVMTGDPALRWRDKSYNEVWHRNGTMGACGAHSAIDGMVMVLFMQQAISTFRQCNGEWTGSESVG